MTPSSVKHGTYTPTLTNVSNLDESTSFACQYMRAGNTVVVSGRVALNATLALVATELGISLPFASVFVAPENLAGSAQGVSVSDSAAISADTTNHRASLQFSPSSAANQLMSFAFTYRVM